jgi:hypothetical protein
VRVAAVTALDALHAHARWSASAILLSGFIVSGQPGYASQHVTSTQYYHHNGQSGGELGEHAQPAVGSTREMVRS